VHQIRHKVSGINDWIVLLVVRQYEIEVVPTIQEIGTSRTWVVATLTFVSQYRAAGLLDPGPRRVNSADRNRVRFSTEATAEPGQCHD
jgi:hypothetical protein